jgi:hypothetical protein
VDRLGAQGLGAGRGTARSVVREELVRPISEEAKLKILKGLDRIPIIEATV